MRAPRLWSVNWKDGMLITQKHLKDQDRYHEELIQWLCSNMADGHGVVSNQAYAGKTLEIVPVLKEGKLIVTIDSCEAITAGGWVVNIGRENQGGSPVTATMDVDPASDETLAVYISVDPETKKEVGEPIVGEEPPRMPYSTYKYDIHLGAPPNLPEGTWMQIAELTLGGSQVALSEDYIPPCLTVSSSTVLYSMAMRFRNTLDNVRKLATGAFVGFAATGESFQLRESFSTILQEVALYLASTVDSYPAAGAQHPSELVLHYKNLLRFYLSLFELHPQVRSFLKKSKIADKEKAFFSEVESFLKGDYRHEDLRSQVASIRGLLGGMEEILIFISELGPAQLTPFSRLLEYKGREYTQLDYERCHFSREGNLHYLTLEGVKAEPLQDFLLLVSKSLFSPQEYSYIDVRIGVNEAKTLGRSDPGEVDTRSYGDRVVFGLVDRLETPDVYQISLIFRGPIDYSKLFGVTPSDVQVYGL